MKWSRGVDARTGVEEWTLIASYENKPRTLWTLYRIQGRRTHRNPSGEYWRASRDGTVLRLNQRVRSWLSRHAAMGAVEELVRLGRAE